VTSATGLVERFARAAREGTGALILPEEEVRLSYSDLWRRCAETAAVLSRKGIARGDRVALPMITSLEVIIGLGALLQLGATVVPLRGRRRPPSEGSDRHAVLFNISAGRAKICLVPDGQIQGYEASLALAPFDIQLVDLHKVVNATATPRAFAPPGPEDGLILQFSSGSTGDPRGIYLTQANVASSVAATAGRLEVTERDRVLGWVPLFHDLGLVGHLFLATYAGCDIVLMPARSFVRDPLSWITQISKYEATMTGAPQFAYDICLARSKLGAEQLKGCDLSKLKVAVNAGEMVNPASCRHFESRFRTWGLRENVISPAYGLADNCLLVSLRKPLTPFPVRHLDRKALNKGEVRMADDRSDAVALAGNGPLGDGVRLRIYSTDGDALDPGMIGEVAVGGDSTARLLAQADGALLPAGEKGFVRTGDIGAMIDGELYLVGRNKEVLQQGGKTFTSPDLEHALYGCEGVLPFGVAAIPVSSPGKADELSILLEVEEESDEQMRRLAVQIRKMLLKSFGIVVRQVILCPRGSLPRTSSGKLRRAVLRRAIEGNYLEDTISVLDINEKTAAAPGES
jgi:acyl-CoA synthetase (AMP-forming)/AMP-acid ligase II